MKSSDLLNQKLTDAKQRWENLSQLISKLQNEYDLETRSDEKMRLQASIEEKKQDQVLIEAEIKELEQQKQKDEISKYKQELFLLKRNKAFQAALETAHYLQSLTPDDLNLAQEILFLEKEINRKTNNRQLLIQLVKRKQEVITVFDDIVKILKTPDLQNEHQELIKLTEEFLEEIINAEDYVGTANALLTLDNGGSATNYKSLAERICQGDMALFLGSDIPRMYGDNAAKESEVAATLAESINYQNFQGTLSSIAEFYQLSMDLGSRRFMKDLNDALPQDPTKICLYHALAKIPAHLILISSSYDNLLEQSFRQANKPFVELASIVTRKKDYDIGHVVVSYSDKEDESIIIPQEQLSKLALLENYSIIYNIRGTCDNDNNPNNVKRHALTLTETNYFAFASNAEKVIPEYISTQLQDLGLLFIGFEPESWEERLLARALLSKRSNSTEPCYTLNKSDDGLQRAYWKSQKVSYKDIDLKQLDEHLEMVKE